MNDVTEVYIGCVAGKRPKFERIRVKRVATSGGVNARPQAYLCDVIPNVAAASKTVHRANGVAIDPAAPKVAATDGFKTDDNVSAQRVAGLTRAIRVHLSTLDTLLADAIRKGKDRRVEIDRGDKNVVILLW